MNPPRDLFWFVQARPRPYFFGAGIVGAYFLLAQQNSGTEFSTLEKIWSRSIFDIQTRPRAPWGGGGAARARAGKNKRILWRKSFFLEKNEKTRFFLKKIFRSETPYGASYGDSPKNKAVFEKQCYTAFHPHFGRQFCVCLAAYIERRYAPFPQAFFGEKSGKSAGRFAAEPIFPIFRQKTLVERARLDFGARARQLCPWCCPS